MVKNLPAHTGDVGSILGSGRLPGEEHGNPLQHSCQGNSMDRGAWQATVYGVTESDTTEYAHMHAHTHTHTHTHTHSHTHTHFTLTAHFSSLGKLFISVPSFPGAADLLTK